MANAWNSDAFYIYPSDCQQYTCQRTFANDLPLSLLSDSCENLTRLSAISSSTKIIVFRKSHKLFRLFLLFRWSFIILFCQDPLKVLKMRLLQKSHFSQMILSFRFVSISQRTMEDQLYYSDYHWFFLLDIWDILNSGVTLRTKRINVHPVLTFDNQLFQFRTHTSVL